jgi:hypothetical protein
MQEPTRFTVVHGTNRYRIYSRKLVKLVRKAGSADGTAQLMSRGNKPNERSRPVPGVCSAAVTFPGLGGRPAGPRRAAGRGVLALVKV